MLAGECEPIIVEAEQLAPLVVDVGGITSALLSALHLEIVEKPGAGLANVGLATRLEPSHNVWIVYEQAPAATLDWRRVVSRVSMAGVEGGLCNKNLRP